MVFALDASWTGGYRFKVEKKIARVLRRIGGVRGLSEDEAIEYLKSLRAILMYLGVNDGNLQEGSFRCDANVSIMRRGAEKYGTRCEIKNMNSFRFLRAAIDYEVRRQVEIVEGGGRIDQETRLFDPDRGETRSMRSKEEAHDYRYFPEPDLPPVIVAPELVARVKASLPELPRARAQRYQQELGLSYPYLGNIFNHRYESTYCPRCGALLPG